MKTGSIGKIGYYASNWPAEPEKKTVLFIHPAGMSGLLWENQIRGLSGLVNAVALDLPGHGESPPPGMANISSYAGAVLDFLQGAGLAKPVVCGLSMGGAIALHLLINNRGLFSGAVLVNTGARLRVIPQIFELIRNDYSSFAGLMGSVALSGKSDREALAPLMEKAISRNADIAFNDFAACNDFDVMQQLGEITVPVLVLSASDDNMTPLKYSLYLKDKITGSRLVTISDAGHFSPLEKPDEVNEAIRVFLHSL